MSSWAGIESSPDQSPTSQRSHAPLGSDEAGSRFVDPAAIRRRLRRQHQPILGSLDAAGVLVQRNFREVVLGSAWILLPSVALNLVATTLAFDRYRTFRTSAVSVPEIFRQADSSSIESLLWYVGLMTTSLAASLVGGYVAMLVVRQQLGLPMRIGGAYRAMLPRLPALLIAWLVGHCWFPLIALALANVSGAVAVPLVIFGVPLVVLAATLSICASPAIVIERLGPIRGLRRSWALARAHFGLLFGSCVVSALIGSLVQYGIAFLPRLLQGTGLLSFGRFGWLIEGVAGQLGRLIGAPLVAVSTALVYLQLRMTTEGMDIVLEADRAFGRSS